MAVQSELINTNAGPFAIRDFGGRGPDLLFVHGTGHNLEVWSPLAQALRGCFRMVAFDMRGHGQTPAQSTGPEQYWRDIEVLMAALGLPMGAEASVDESMVRDKAVVAGGQGFSCSVL